MATTVSMSLEELDQMRDEAKRLAAQVTQLTSELAAARVGDHAPLLKLCRDSIEIVQFAVGNLSPEYIKRWPYAKLRNFANGIVLLPDATVNESELAVELLKFAMECEMWETKRKSEPERYIPPPPGFDDHGRPVDKDGKVVGPPKHLIGYPQLAEAVGTGKKIEEDQQIPPDA